MAWLLAGVWQLKRTRRNTDKTGDRFVEVKSLLYTNLRIVWKLENKISNIKWLSMNK
jgi:hypothetical protein